MPFLRRATRTTIEFFRPIPSVALVPIAILLFGLRLQAALVIIVYASFWQVFVQVLYGVADVDVVARDTARSFGLSRMARFRSLVLPSALPYIMTGVRLAAAVALILTITAEMAIGNPGLGHNIVHRPVRRATTSRLRDRHRDGHPRRRLINFAFRAIERRVSRGTSPCAGRSWHERRRARGPRDAGAGGGSARAPRALNSLTATPHHLHGVGRVVERLPTPSSSPFRTRSSARSSTRGSAPPSPPTCSRASPASTLGLVASIAIGIVVGTFIGLVRWLRELLEPMLEFFRAIPPPAMIPVIALLLGPTDTMKVVVIILGAMWPVLLNTIDGVRSTDSVMKDTARSFGISGFDRVRLDHPPGGQSAHHDGGAPGDVDRASSSW